MTTANASRAIKLCGTEQPDVSGRVLTAGPLSAELDNGNLRYIKVAGVEVLRSLAFLVRDENWGTYVPTLSDVVVEQRADGFGVSLHAVCRRADQEIGYYVRVEGDSDGNLLFDAVATPATDFLTARTGFVVLHPLAGVAGRPVEVEHTDGTVESSSFPALVDPIQPFLNIRALTHEVLPGLKATVRMEGDAFEMEDHRNWTDASFKTYVRPLALPWPYTLPGGVAIRQSVTLTLAGPLPRRGRKGGETTVRITLGTTTGDTMPRVGLGMPAEEIEAALAAIDLVARISPRLMICQFDPRAGHGPRELDGYRRLVERTGADCELEVVVESVDAYAEELRRVAALVLDVRLPLAAIAVCPAGDLKSVLPGGVRPPAPPLDGLYRAARAAFPGVRLGGGMFSFFTELNRKRPPAELLDFVHNGTCPIVHAADDRSVMETHEALPYQVATARSFIGKTPYRIGPSAIGCRDNPHGATYTANPGNQRICLVKSDPRQRALFGAAWTLAYVASFARTGVEAVSLGAPTGPLGFVHRPGDNETPYYDTLRGPAVYPAYHVVSGLTRAAGTELMAAASSDAARVCTLAYRTDGASLLWLANLTARDQPVRVDHAGAGAYGIVLDEGSFESGVIDPVGFQTNVRQIDLGRLTLRPYALALVSINDA